MTFKRPYGAGLAALAILAGLCAIGFAEPAFAQAADAAKDAAPAAAAAPVDGVGGRVGDRDLAQRGLGAQRLPQIPAIGGL